MRNSLERLSKKYSVVLVEPLYDLNIGYIARVMKNFGLSNLIVVNPRTEIGDKALIFAAHARDIISNIKVVESFNDIISDFDIVVGTTGKISRYGRFVRIPITPRQFAKNIKDVEGKVAIVFGREDVGLTNEELEKCNILVTIPANPAYPILNISHAVAVILYEIYVTECAGETFSFHKLPSASDFELFMNYLKDITQILGLPSKKEENIELIFKRILGRATVSKRELYALIAFLRKIYIRLSSQSSQGKR